MANVTKVELQNKQGRGESFELSHASALLQLRNTQWALPEDSEYELKNGNIVRKHKKEANADKRSSGDDR